MNAHSNSVPATEIDAVDAMVTRLDAHKAAWSAMSAADRAALLRRCMETTLAVSEEWAETACRIKGYALGSNGHGEEFLGGTLPTMRNLRLFAEALEANGQPPLPKTWQRADGQWIAQVYPQSMLDQALFTGVSCELWIEPGEEPTQGRIYRDPSAKHGGGVAVVLGAGNQSSIAPMDVLTKLVVDDEVCILKMNPVNEALGPIIERAFAPLVEAGFLEVCYGGIEVGKHLTDHPLTTSIHITGSAFAHDAIVWGVGEEGAKNKAAGTKRLDKPISSELGAVSPALMVPGEWTAKELDYHARQTAAMLAYNCGFNCNAARLIVVASGWKQKDEFFALVKQKLAATPTRHAYYPTAKATFERFAEQYPDREEIGGGADSHTPWTILRPSSEPGEYALTNEPWCSIFSFVELEASTPAEFLDKAVPFANDQCWGTLSMQLMVDPRTEKALGSKLEDAIAALRYGNVAVNVWTGLMYGLVNTTWGAFPGHPADDIQSGNGVVHNGLLLDHPQKSVLRAPFTIFPTPAWFTDHKNNLALGRVMTRFEGSPSWLKLPGVVWAAFQG